MNSNRLWFLDLFEGTVTSETTTEKKNTSVTFVVTFREVHGEEHYMKDTNAIRTPVQANPGHYKTRKKQGKRRWLRKKQGKRRWLNLVVTKFKSGVGTWIKWSTIATKLKSTISWQLSIIWSTGLLQHF